MEREYNKEIVELVAKPIKSDLNCLISISGHKLLRADIVIFKVVLRKWFDRFHTSQISRRLSLVSDRSAFASIQWATATPRVSNFFDSQAGFHQVSNRILSPNPSVNVPRQINSGINQFVKLHVSRNFSTKLGSLIRCVTAASIMPQKGC